jgi:hypothetical protein
MTASPDAQQRAETSPDGAGRGDRLVDAVQATLARLSESADDGRAAASLMTAIDAIARMVRQQSQEVVTARSTVTRLTAENGQLRQLLKQLLTAVQTSGITAAAAIETADRRLRDLVQADPVPDSSPPATQPVVPLRPATRGPADPATDAPRGGIRVIE